MSRAKQKLISDAEAAGYQVNHLPNRAIDIQGRDERGSLVSFRLFPNGTALSLTGALAIRSFDKLRLHLNLV